MAITLGQFLKNRQPDSPNSPFTASPEKDLLSNAITGFPPGNPPRIILPLQLTPVLSPFRPLVFSLQAPKLFLDHPPSKDIIPLARISLTHAAARQPSLPITPAQIAKPQPSLPTIPDRPAALQPSLATVPFNGPIPRTFANAPTPSDPIVRTFARPGSFNSGPIHRQFQPVQGPLGKAPDQPPPVLGKPFTSEQVQPSELKGQIPLVHDAGSSSGQHRATSQNGPGDPRVIAFPGVRPPGVVSNFQNIGEDKLAMPSYGAPKGAFRQPNNDPPFAHPKVTIGQSLQDAPVARGTQDPYNMQLRTQETYSFGMSGETASKSEGSKANPLKSTVLYQPGMTIGQRLKAVDSKLFDYLKVVGSIDSTDVTNPGASFTFVTGGALGAPGSQAWNPILYAKHVVRLANHLGVSGLATFAATQLGLHLLNRHGKIWNPLTAIPPPILIDILSNTIDSMTGTPRFLTGYKDTEGGGLVISSQPGFYESNVLSEGGDRHKQWGEGTYNEFQIVGHIPFVVFAKLQGSMGPQNNNNFLFDRLVGARSQDKSLVDDITALSFDPDAAIPGSPMPIIKEALTTRNFYHEKKKYSDGAHYTIDSLVNEALGETSDTSILALDSSKGTSYKIINNWAITSVKSPSTGIAALFSNPNIQLSYPQEFKPKLAPLTKVVKGDLEKAAFPKGLIPAAFDAENDFGFIVHRKGKSPSTIIKDDVAYVPLSFTDLRPINGDLYRTVYFRPFNVELRESKSVDWNKAHYIGRVDPIVTYQSTNRSLNVSFQMHAFGPEDLETMYQKLNWLDSFVYPEYDGNFNLKSGPVIRLRIGDVINSLGPDGFRGLPGIIESLEFDYSNSIWELKSGMKVPRSIKVSLSFVVLHDRPIGRGADGKFGGLGEFKDIANGKANIFLPSSTPQAGTSVLSPQVKEGISTWRTFGDINGYKVPVVES